MTSSYSDRDHDTCPDCHSNNTVRGGLMLANGAFNGGYAHCVHCNIYFDIYGGDILDPEKLIDTCWMSDKDFENGSKFD